MTGQDLHKKVMIFSQNKMKTQVMIRQDLCKKVMMFS